MVSIAALGLVRALQIPLGLLATLHLDGFLWPPEPKVENGTCFDYLIVGGGTAGMVLAARLSEIANINVLVLEAGGDPTLEALLPLLFVLQPESRVDWDFASTRNNYAANSQPGNVTKLTSGRMLGGSSCMNHFIHVRGNPQGFNRWAEIVGDDTWKYENVLPYFEKSENLKDEGIEESPYGQYHGYSGPMGVARQPSLAANPYLVSFGELGNKVVPDINGPDTLGYTQCTFTVTDGVRQCTAYSYIRPVRLRKNLYVLRNTYVTKIVFDGNRAIGVIAYRNNMKYFYRASREVIISAGNFKTPQILMLSGIGPREHLESYNINVLADLPVGDNWQEQQAVTIVHKTDKSIVDPVIPLPTIVPFPVLVGMITLNETQRFGDYQVFGLVIGKATPNLLLACAIVFGYRPEICDELQAKVFGHNSLYSLITLLQPKSRGKVRLVSTDPFDDPELETNFYDKEEDLNRMVRYVQDYIKVGNTTFFREINAKLLNLNKSVPECKNYTYLSDDYWRCYILHTTASLYHSTGTSPMGTVLDSRLRVKNVTGLRVVDSSVIPEIPAGSPHAMVIMIAEKASDMIKEDADRFSSCEKCCESWLPKYRDNTTMNNEESRKLTRL